MVDPRLGSTDADGNQQFPQVTVSGRPLSGSSGAVHGLDVAGYFVVLDTFPPAGFDLATVEAELMASIAPVAAQSVVKKTKVSVDADQSTT